MGTTTTIRASITALDGEIERLTNARNALANLITDNGVEVTPERKRSSRKAAIAEDSGAKSSSRATKRSTSRKSQSKNGNGNGESRRDQIIALLDQGMTAREIGDELGIAPNYVYHVKRSM